MKKVFKILLIVLITIALNATIINADSIPASNAKASGIMTFWKNHKDENDDIWDEVSIDKLNNWIEILNDDKNETGNAGVDSGMKSTSNALKKILEKKNSEKAEQEKLIKDGEEYKEKLQNAYKTIPEENADAETINTFIKSENQYNQGQKFKNKEISIDTVKKWDETLKAGQIDTVSRINYQTQRDVLNEYINAVNEKTNNLDNKINNSANAAQATENANNETIKNAKIKLAVISGSSGTSRTDNVFKDDVLDNVNSYNPSDSSSTDDSEATTIISDILSAITSVGTVVSVVMLAILGVKYMLGSVEEKAEYKKDLIPYFIGSILLFGICTIVKMLQTLGNSINNL